MSATVVTPARPVRYPLLLGVVSVVWSLVAWTGATLAPRVAFLPGVEILHLALPAFTAALILINLGFALWALWRGARVDQLLIVTSFQIGLFTALFFQIAAHLGAEHFKLAGPVQSWKWVEFSLIHALRASDILDTIEAYGLNVQTIKHKGLIMASTLVVYHAIIDLFVLRLMFSCFKAWQRKKLNDPKLADELQKLIRVLLLLPVFPCVVWWLVLALVVRPWEAIDIPLWLVENIVRVIDFTDIMDSFDIHWHQVPKRGQENTLTFLCRFWIAMGVAYLLEEWRRWATVRPSADGEVKSPLRPLWRLGMALAIFGLFVGLAQLPALTGTDPCPELVQVATATDEERARAALSALKRLGPNAEAAVEPLVEARPRVDEDRWREIIATLGHLGPRAATTLIAIADSADERDASIAVKELERIGPVVSPALMRMRKTSQHETVRTLADASLRKFGPEALPALIPTMTRANSIAYLHLFEQLDRNWSVHDAANNEAFQEAVAAEHSNTLMKYNDRTLNRYDFRAIQWLKEKMGFGDE